jgi:hypothetical protein
MVTIKSEKKSSTLKERLLTSEAIELFGIEYLQCPLFPSGIRTTTAPEWRKGALQSLAFPPS